MQQATSAIAYMRMARTPRTTGKKASWTHKQSNWIMEHGFLLKQAYRGTGGQKDSRAEVNASGVMT
jgi:hypothetical protein